MSFINAKVTPGVTCPADYHGHEIQRGQPEYPMSPSELKEFARCQSRWAAG